NQLNTHSSGDIVQLCFILYLELFSESKIGILNNVLLVLTNERIKHFYVVNDKWIYLTTMIDLADRQVVGWSLSKDMTYENTVLKAWNIARKRRQIIDEFLLHSDRGIQYACNKIRNVFRDNDKINRSMSRKGNCWDNAVAESFFKTIKSEMIYRNDFKSFTHAYNEVYDYIENWYNIKFRINPVLNIFPLSLSQPRIAHFSGI
ncbi:hypothetical protein DLK05_16930, partial [Ancylomarina longa]